MRLSRLHLRNFRGFASTTIDLESGTALVGPNNAGKSTIVEAIECLFDLDPRRRDNWTWADLAPTAAGPVGIPRPELDAIVSVIGEFSDLSESVRAGCADICPDGVIRFGRLFRYSGGMNGTCSLVPESLVEGFVRANPSGAEIAAVFAEIPQFGGDFWIDAEDGRAKLDYLGDASGLALTVRDYPSVAHIISLPGPEHRWPPFDQIVRPILRSRISAAIGVDRWGFVFDQENAKQGPFEALVGSAVEAVNEVERALSSIVPQYVDGAKGVSVPAPTMLHQIDIDKIIDAATGEVRLSVEQSGGREDSLEALGGGAQRAASLAALQLYSDPNLWPPDQWLVLCVEEPEVGLHPAAQRAVAQALADLPTYGVQTVLVTHSPTFINAVPPEGIRIIRDRLVTLPEGMDEIRSVLGAKPADVLLARRLVIVEGKSDAQILSAWARTLGFNLSRDGVELIPADGYGVVKALSRFAVQANPGSSILVVLDNGPDTSRVEREITRTLPDVIVHKLQRSEIESYFSAEAISRWLLVEGAAADEANDKSIKQLLDSTEGGGRAKDALESVARSVLNRRYSVPKDGALIAELTPEGQIAGEIRDLITQLAE